MQCWQYLKVGVGAHDDHVAGVGYGAFAVVDHGFVVLEPAVVVLEPVAAVLEFAGVPAADLWVHSERVLVGGELVADTVAEELAKIWYFHRKHGRKQVKYDYNLVMLRWYSRCNTLTLHW